MKRLSKSIRKKLRNLKALTRAQFVDLSQGELKLKDEVNKFLKNYQSYGKKDKK